jgi:sensor histidine kinase YesM
MRINTKTILMEVRDILLLAGVSAVLVLSGIACRQCNDNPRLVLIVTSLTAILWILLWKGNEVLANMLSKRISWIDYPVRRFVAGFVVTVFYTLSIVFMLGMIYERLFTIYLSSTMVTSVIIALVISLFMHGRAFLQNWRSASIEAERFERESILARYESLKNQVSPHFLFNSLNALTHLVYQDKDKASRFIHQLSMVYRYVLDTRHREVVSLSEEIDFVRSYLYLQQIRFGSKLEIQIEQDGDMGGFVPPLAIQMLIENAIKHNIVSEEDPLRVKVFTTGKFAVVENNLQPKSRMDEHSSGVGLENIRRRYEILSKEQVLVEKDDNCFRVSIPLLGETVLPSKKALIKP